MAKMEVKVNQIHELVNKALKMTLGVESINVEDLTSLVDIGSQVTATANTFDSFMGNFVPMVNTVANQIRSIEDRGPNIGTSGTDWGVMLVKYKFGLPEASESDPWNLKKGNSYDPNKYNPLETSAYVWSERVTKTITLSVTRRQLKAAFNSMAQLDSFIAGIFVAVDNRIALDEKNVKMAVITNAIAATIQKNIPDPLNYGKQSHLQARNLLLDYYNMKTAGGEAYTGPTKADNCTYDPDFARFAIAEINKARGYMTGSSVNFNQAGRVTHTPKSAQKAIFLADFIENAKVYLYSGANQYTTEHITLEDVETVPYWQSPDDYKFHNLSDIWVKPKTEKGTSAEEVHISGVLGVVFDEWAIASHLYDPTTRTYYNADGDFENYWFEYLIGFLNDFSENIVTFYVQDLDIPAA